MWSWLVSVVLGPLFGAISNWLEAEQARIDEQRLGQQTQAAADEKAQVVQAVADEQKVADVVQAENASLAKSNSESDDELRQPSPDSRD
jgi:hypothetical protein